MSLLASPLVVTAGAAAGAAAGVSLPARPVPSRTAATTAAETVPPPMAASQREPPPRGGGACGGGAAYGGSGGGGGVYVRVGGPSVQRRSMWSPESGFGGDARRARVSTA